MKEEIEKIKYQKNPSQNQYNLSKEKKEKSAPSPIKKQEIIIQEIGYWFGLGYIHNYREYLLRATAKYGYGFSLWIHRCSNGNLATIKALF